jgi:hypothetical protein
MATKIIRFVSQQSGPFNASNNNKVDINIPSYVSYIDPTQSCITLNLKLLNGTADLGLFDVGFNDGLDARCLLKNITISSDKNGVIEQIPAANILYANIDQTQRDFEDENAKAVYGFGTTADNLGTGNLATFIRKVNNGSALSTQETYLKIPLSSIFGVCKMQQFPFNLFGNIKITLEFEDDNSKIVPYLFKQVICNTVTIDNTLNANGATTTLKVKRAQSLPLYVGMPITVALDTATPGTTTDTTIASINYNASDDSVSVKVANSVTLDVTKVNVIQARGSGVGDKDLTYQIRDVEIEVYQYNLMPAQQSKLNANMRKGLSLGFNTWSLERVNMPTVEANNQYTRQFDLEPGTVNVFAMLPKLFDAARGTANSQPLFSLNDGFSEYRWRLNTIDTTSRDIVPYQSLYYDRLMTTLSNSYMKIKNLRLTGGKAPSDATASPQSDANVKTYLIPSPIPRSDDSQVLQLRMLRKTPAANDGSTILHLYKQVQKDLKIQAGGIQVM